MATCDAIRYVVMSLNDRHALPFGVGGGLPWFAPALPTGPPSEFAFSFHPHRDLCCAPPQGLRQSGEDVDRGSEKTRALNRQMSVETRFGARLALTANYSRWGFPVSQSSLAK